MVAFSHGSIGVIDSNFSTCKELAANGYVVASIAHTYHAFFVKDVNGKVTTVDTNFFNQVMTIDASDTPEHEEVANGWKSEPGMKILYWIQYCQKPKIKRRDLFAE